MRTLLICVLICAAGLPASDWSRFRGPNGTGVSPDRDLPAELSRERNLIWQAKTPKGNSSPIVVAGRLYITGHEGPEGQNGNERLMLCYDAKTGALLWRKAITKSRSEVANPLNGPTTPTPATDGRAVFAFFPEFGLIAYRLNGNEGDELWRTPLGPFTAIQGMAVSPVYAEGRVVLLVDTPEQAFLAAFDAETGKQVWKVDRPIGFLGSYSTPSLYKTAGGQTQITVAGATELTGYDPKSGQRLWWAPGVTWAPAAAPLVAGDSVYTLEPVADAAPPFGQMLKQFDKDNNGKIELSEASGEGINDKIMHRVFKSVDKNTGDNDGAVTEEEFKRAFSPDRSSGGLVRTRLAGKGDVSKTHVVWRHTKGLPYVTAPLLYENVLYVVRNGGMLSTFDPETGKLLREERLKTAIGDYYASPVAGDGKIYLVNKDGKISVLKAGPDWTVLSSDNLDEQVIATPAIADRRVYVRTDAALYCFGAKAARPAGVNPGL